MAMSAMKTLSKAFTSFFLAEDKAEEKPNRRPAPETHDMNAISERQLTRHEITVSFDGIYPYKYPNIYVFC